MNKLSKYVYFLRINENYFIYNLTNGQGYALHSKIFDIIQNLCDIDLLGKVHPDLFKALTDSKFIIGEDIVEEIKLIESFKKNDNNPEYFNVIINPTLDCNLRCWYCYETHHKGSIMNSKTLESVKKLIEQKITDQRLKHLGVTFFGGEPLLGWKKVIDPILTYAEKQCKSKNVRLSTGFTTNGVLINEIILKRLTELNLTGAYFQISLDGNRNIHNKSRVGINKKPTYDLILKNIQLALDLGYNINLRFNYTPDNINCFEDVIEDLKNIPDNQRNRLKCNFQKVWQAGQKTDFLKEMVFNYIQALREIGFVTESDFIFHRHNCYADKENSIVVNYNGDLFKCTAREFSKENREGELQKDGNAIWNEKYYRRMDIKYSDPLCLECKLLPICNGGCSTIKLENESTKKHCKKQEDYAFVILNNFYQNILKQKFSGDRNNIEFRNENFGELIIFKTKKL